MIALRIARTDRSDLAASTVASINLLLALRNLINRTVGYDHLAIQIYERAESDISVVAKELAGDCFLIDTPQRGRPKWKSEIVCAGAGQTIETASWTRYEK
jgi:hypothetical protein